MCRLHSNTTAFYTKNLGIAILVSPRNPGINHQKVQRMTVYRRPSFCLVYLTKIKFQCLMVLYSYTKRTSLTYIYLWFKSQYTDESRSKFLRAKMPEKQSWVHADRQPFSGDKQVVWLRFLLFFCFSFM